MLASAAAWHSHSWLSSRAETREARRREDHIVHCTLARFLRPGSMSFRAEGRDASVCVREAHARLAVEDRCFIACLKQAMNPSASVAASTLLVSSRAQRGICCFPKTLPRAQSNGKPLRSLCLCV